MAKTKDKDAAAIKALGGALRRLEAAGDALIGQDEGGFRALLNGGGDNACAALVGAAIGGAEDAGDDITDAVVSLAVARDVVAEILALRLQKQAKRAAKRAAKLAAKRG